MLTDEEALQKAEDEYWMNGSPEFRTGFRAALEWVRSQGEPLTDSFVQTVPDKCDRIVWRGHYYQLPFAPEPKSC